MLNKQITHVYFIPGLAASSSIFEGIKLPLHYKLHFLDWLQPINHNEPLPDYVDRLIEKIKEPNPVIIGVSFGGIIAQEIAKKIAVNKIIIISSIKSRDEMPKIFKIISATRLNKIFPTGIFKDFEQLKKIAVTKSVEKKLELYKKHMKHTDKLYLDWAIKNMFGWKSTKLNQEIIHIQGTKDNTFPIKHITNCIPVHGASHVLVLSHARWLNNYLPKLMENEINIANFDKNRL